MGDDVTYSTPQLKRLGSLQELTLGASGLGNDAQSRVKPSGGPG